MTGGPAGGRRVRGEIHPGLVVAGVLLAMGLAWWFAQSDASRERSASASPSVADRPAGGTGIPARPGEPDASAAAKPLYRWTDAAGVVHFTDIPPTDRPYVEVDVDPDRNVVTLPSPVEP